MFKNILVAVDGSEHGQKAARMAGDLARAFQANLCVVIAYDPVPKYLGQPYLDQAITQRLNEADQILKEALEQIGQVPGALRREVLEGSPAEAILAVAETREIDLIVMGTRGLSRLAGIFIGSQSQKVAAHARCPVLLVH